MTTSAWRQQDRHTYTCLPAVEQLLVVAAGERSLWCDCSSWAAPLRIATTTRLGCDLKQAELVPAVSKLWSVLPARQACACGTIAHDRL
jgi:hypothetical protein